MHWFMDEVSFDLCDCPSTTNQARHPDSMTLTFFFVVVWSSARNVNSHIQYYGKHGINLVDQLLRLARRELDQLYLCSCPIACFIE